MDLRSWLEKWTEENPGPGTLMCRLRVQRKFLASAWKISQKSLPRKTSKLNFSPTVP